jgi:hypothetical protein
MSVFRIFYAIFCVYVFRFLLVLDAGYAWRFWRGCGMAAAADRCR